ncbi:MAG: hypothetical protein ACOYOT_11470 [Bacteroidales bacterium]
MKLLIRFCSIAVLLLIITSCSTPAPIVKLSPSPIDSKDYWNMGQHFVYENNKNVWFDCAFNCIDNDKLVFDVKITNESDTAILVDPELFTQKVYMNDSVLMASESADNPESVLDKSKWDENVAVARANNATALSIFSFALAAGTSIAVAASSHKNIDEKINAINGIAIANDFVQASVASNHESENIRAADNWTKRKMLNEAFLRKTTIPKGTHIDGEVHFPYHKKANWYDLFFSVGSAKAYFYFKQEVVFPKPQTNQQN